MKVVQVIALVFVVLVSNMSHAQIDWMTMDQALAAQKLEPKKIFMDVYTDWCGPCKMVAPILEELSDENPEITIYKVDTEVEQELSAVFQIRSIPSILFIPMDKQPMMQAGALPKHTLEEII